MGKTRSIHKSAVLALFFILAPVFTSLAAGLPSERLEIDLKHGSEASFSVEVAATPEQREVGLMNRKAMAADHGMLFDFGIDRRVYMWMRNTLIPLDMLFVARDGTIVHIRENAEVLSEDIIDSHADVRFVVELNAGRVRALGIADGDRVSSPTIAAAAAGR
jgi:uncharacterized protein